MTIPSPNPSASVEKEARVTQARRFLAIEYERDGHAQFAAEVRDGILNRTGMGAAIRAMLAFAEAATLTERERAAKVAEDMAAGHAGVALAVAERIAAAIRSTDR